MRPVTASRIRATGILALLSVALLAACGGGGGGSPEASGTLSFTACVIPEGGAACEATVNWSTRNAGAVSVTVDGETLAEGTSGATPLVLSGDVVTVALVDGTTTLDSARVRGPCETATAWDGSRCTVYAVRLDERANTPFVEDGRAVELEVVLFKPAGDGPFPTVLFNHGSTGDGSDPSLFTITSVSEPVAKFFVDRGWMVAFPQRRGRGQSDGLYDEGFNADRSFYSCEREIALAGFERAAADAAAALDWLRGRADVDTTMMVASGVSRGGTLALVHAARRPDVFLGAVSFVGGWLGEGCGDYAAVNRGLAVYAAAFPGDTLWLYGNNDSFYSVAHSRANFDAYTAAGGLGEFRVYTRAPGLNGHFLANDPGLWGPDVEAYLGALP
ncbi:MAG: CocE/NonD family hydrolase [Gammaproteobacteria bacterium]